MPVIVGDGNRVGNLIQYIYLLPVLRTQCTYSVCCVCVCVLVLVMTF